MKLASQRELSLKFGKTIDTEQYYLVKGILEKPNSIWQGVFTDSLGDLVLERRMSKAEIEQFNAKHGVRLATEYDTLPIWDLTKEGKTYAPECKEPNHWC